MVKRFRTKVVEIEAVQFTGENYAELRDWTVYKFFPVSAGSLDDPEFIAEVFDVLRNTWILVKAGQWIVRGAKGEFHPCDDETFHWKYEEVRAPAYLKTNRGCFEITPGSPVQEFE